MPIDRKLALECLKRDDQDLYYMCYRLEEINEYAKGNEGALEKLHNYLSTVDLLEKLEKQGDIEIINDYHNQIIRVRDR